MSTILIKNATVADGSGSPCRLEDIAIADGKFVRPDAAPDEIIDAAGLVCLPGFIDTHSHSDIQVLIDPYVRPKIRQGITTEILGQDGISAAPLPPRFVEAWRKNLSGLDGDSESLDWSWQDTRGYLDRIESGKGSATNVAYLVPHGNLRMAALGLEDRPAGPSEIAEMRRLLEQELDAGAVGLSSGLIYIPCAYANQAELTALCAVAGRRGKPFVVHQRSEADDVVASMREILDIARDTGVHAHFSHFKICGMRNRHLRDAMAAMLDEAKRQGLDVSFDQYPYTAGCTTMTALLPPWAQSGGADQLLARLGDASERERIARDMRDGIPGWDDFLDFAGADHIHITSVHSAKNMDVAGKTLAEIADQRGIGVYDAVFDLLREENLAVSIATEFGLDEDIAFFMRRPEQNVCTDGLFGAKPHPRVYGSFARILEKYVKQDKVLTLEEAAHKMAGKPAALFGLTGRGLIAPGKQADFVLVDMNRIADKATYLDPIRYPEGFVSVWVNGQAVFRDGTDTPALPGTVVRICRQPERMCC